jgi:uncharacterized alpha-E superfamily protein
VTTQGLLSRLAESLFWIGRYVERADDTSRIVDAYLHRLLEDPFEDESLACQSLLAIMGLEIGPEVVATTEGVMSALAFDPSNPSAIVGSWRSVRSQSVRLGPHVFLRGIRDRAALFAGLTDATMSRSDPWRFVALGRALERVDMTTRLLSVRVTAGGHAPNWPTLLRAAGAEEAFLQAHVGVDEPQRIAEFLLLDRLFPRSIFHALSVAETCLSELETTQNRSGVTDPARRIIGQTKTALEYMDSDRLLPELAESLERISEACAAASVAIAQRYFGSITTVEWKAEQG